MARSTRANPPADTPATTPASQPAAVPASDVVEQLTEAVKPRLRGMIHLVLAPLALAVGITLVALSPTPAARWSTAVFGLATTTLFTLSTIYHRGRWRPRTHAVLRRIDHSNIFLVIAGTYTPLSVLLLPADTARTLLLVVWGGAVAGILMRVLWLNAPRWLYVPLYVALGCVVLGFLPAFWTAGGPAVVWLVAGGGLGYVLGAVVYGLKRPNPSPRWFGFHEIFHTCTLVGYTCHAVAIFLVVAQVRAAV